MKTYWLDRRECRMPLIRRASSVGTKSEIDKLEKGSISGLTSIEERRVYSPVTFQDIARRSIANSPVKINQQRGRLCCLAKFFFISFHLFAFRGSIQDYNPRGYGNSQIRLKQHKYTLILVLSLLSYMHFIEYKLFNICRCNYITV